MVTFKRICPVCEAGCGLRVTADGRRIVKIEGNADDVFSEGHVCPKGMALIDVDGDPKRLRKPLLLVDGEHVEVSWREAYEAIRKGLNAIREDHGADAVAVYLGNPTVHNVGLSLGIGFVVRALRTRNIFSAASVDQLPKQVANELMFGNDVAWPVPDIERTDYLLMLGANPAISNGSLWMVPKFRARLRALKRRGGKFVTVDPRVTETGRLADRHLAIKPGTDAWLLAALINRLQQIGLNLPERYPAHGARELLAHLAGIDVAEAASRCGVAPAEIEAVARDLASASRPVVYGRIGTTLQSFGTLTSFLVEVVNLLTGSFDTAGGAMFPEQPYVSFSRRKSGLNYNRYRTRVSGMPEVAGQLPVSCLAEEIETPGDGQIRALVCFAGNPVMSAPDSARIAQAVASLNFHVSVDIYRNESNRTANVILPGASPFEEPHYDHFFGASGYRNAARFSPAQFAMPDGQPDEWDVALAIAFGLRSDEDFTASRLAEFEDDMVAGTVQRYVDDADGALAGRDVQAIVAAIEPVRGVERLLDLGIRAGKWGDHFGRRDGLTLAGLVEQPDGVDLGELRPRLSEVCMHPDGKLDLAPPVIMDEITRLIATESESGFSLIGRRNVKTNNTWMHDLSMLRRGSDVCVLEIHADDAEDLGVSDGDDVVVANADSEVEVAASLSRRIARGVVSLPHGFARANYNVLTPSSRVDKPSGTAAFNGVSVRIRRGARPG